MKALQHVHLFLGLLEWLGTVITQKPYRLVQIGIVSAKNRINNFPPREPSSAALNVLCMNAGCKQLLHDQYRCACCIFLAQHYASYDTNLLVGAN